MVYLFMKYWWLHVANVAILKSPKDSDSPRMASLALGEVRPCLGGPAFQGDWRPCSDLPRAPRWGRLKMRSWSLGRCVFFICFSKTNEEKSRRIVDSGIISKI